MRDPGLGGLGVWRGSLWLVFCLFSSCLEEAVQADLGAQNWMSFQSGGEKLSTPLSCLSYYFGADNVQRNERLFFVSVWFSSLHYHPGLLFSSPKSEDIIEEQDQKYLLIVK